MQASTLGHGIVSQIMRTLIEIIETKQSFRVGRVTYCLIMIIFICQLYGYILFSTENRWISEEKVSVLAAIFAHSTLFYTLAEQGFNIFIQIVVITLTACLLLLTSYILLLTYLRVHLRPAVFDSLNHRIFNPINQALNLFLVFFQWLIYVPILEISTSLFYCNDYTYIIFYQNNCDDYPLRLRFSSTINIVLIGLIGGAITYLYRNYEFNELELMKRKYSPLNIFQFYAIIMLVMISYGVKGSIVYQIINAFVLTLTQFYQITYSLPFRDKTIMRFYSFSISFFFCGLGVTSAWVLIDSYQDSDIFYTLLLTTTVFTGFITGNITRTYDVIMNISAQNFHKYYEFIDVYLEEMFRLADQQSTNSQLKFDLIKLLQTHQSNCINHACECKRSLFITNQGYIDQDAVYALIESIFAWSLTQKPLINNKREFEYVSLKYISYLSKYRNNPSKALLQLKNLSHSRGSNLGFYFRMISSILQRRIEADMVTIQSLRTNHSPLSSQSSSALADTAAVTTKTTTSPNDDIKYPISIDGIMRLERFSETSIQQIAEYIKRRIDYWSNIEQGNITSMRALYAATISIARVAKSIDTVFLRSFQNRDSYIYKSAKMLKLFSLYKCLIRSDTTSTYTFERRYQDLLQYDQESAYISNLNFSRGNIIQMTMSLSKEKGLIISKVNEKFLRFFGYRKEDTSLVKSVNQIIPPHVSLIHSYLIDNYLSRGYSNYVNQFHFNFALTKLGFLLPVNIYLNATQLYPDDYSINALFVASLQAKDYMIANKKGSLQGITSNLFNMIQQNKTKKETKFQVEQLLKDMNVYFIFPDLARVILNRLKLANSLKDQTNTSSTGEQEKLSRQIPLKVPAEIQKLQLKFKQEVFQEIQLKKLAAAKQSAQLKSVDHNSSWSNTFIASNNILDQLDDDPDFLDRTDSEVDEQIYLEKFIAFHKHNSQVNNHRTFSLHLSIYLQIQINLSLSPQKWEVTNLSAFCETKITVTRNKLQYTKRNKSMLDTHYVFEIDDIKPMKLSHMAMKNIAQINTAPQLPFNSSNALEEGQNSPRMTENQSPMKRQKSYFSHKSIHYQQRMGRTSEDILPRQLQILNETDATPSTSRSYAPLVSSPKYFPSSGTAAATPPIASSHQYLPTESEGIANGHSIKRQSTFQRLEDNTTAGMTQQLHLQQQQHHQPPQSSNRLGLLSDNPALNSLRIESAQFLQSFGSSAPRIPSLLLEKQAKQLNQASQLEITTNTEEKVFSYAEQTDDEDNIGQFRIGSQNPIFDEAENENDDNLDQAKKGHSHRHKLNRMHKQGKDQAKKTGGKSKQNHSEFNQTKRDQLEFNHDEQPHRASSVHSVQGYKTKDGEIINTILAKKTYLPITRLKFVFYSLLLVFLIFVALCGVEFVPLLKTQETTLEHFEPANEIEIAFILSALYNFIANEINIELHSTIIVDFLTPLLPTFLAQIIQGFHKNTETILSESSQFPSMQETDFYNVSIFSGSVEWKQEMGFSEILMYNYESVVRSVTPIQNDSASLSSARLFLLSNMKSTNAMCSDLLKDIQSNMNSQITDFSSNSVLFLTIIMISFICVCTLAIHFIRRINFYNERILNILTRISIAEITEEMTKLRSIYETLTISSTDFWLKVDFRSIYTRSLKLQSHFSHSNSAATPQSSQSTQKKKAKKDQHLNSMIKDTQFSSIHSIITIILICVVLLAYFILIGSLAISYSEKIKPQMTIYTKFLQIRSEFTKLITAAEVIATHVIVEENESMFSILFDTSHTDWRHIYANSLASIKEFYSSYSQLIANSPQKELIENVFQGNLCNVFSGDKATLQCSTNYSITGQSSAAEKGLSGILSSTITYFDSFSELLASEPNSSSIRQQLMSAYLNAPQHTDLVILNTELPQEAFASITSIMREGIYSSINAFFILAVSYLSIGVIMISCIIYGTVQNHIAKQESNINLMNFSLLMLPHAKMNEENTKHLLTQLISLS